MSSEEIIQQLLNFVYRNGRLPKSDEPGFEKLIDATVKTFGSLENALRVAGLLTNDQRVTRFRKPRQSSIAFSTPKIKQLSKYPQDYFLNLLNLKRTQFHGSPAPEGTPTWWERRAKAQYNCSACRKTIEKGERYVGRKTLRSGMRGIYGYRGTYSTDYYHIICLLRSAEAQIEKNIESANLEVEGIKKEISDYRQEVSSKRDDIVACGNTITQAKEEYEQSHGFLRRISKWFGSHYTSWSKNKEISRLEREIADIENREMPERQTRVANLTSRVDNLQHRLIELRARIQELESF